MAANTTDKGRMLVIDDDPVVIESCVRVFESEGFTVASTTDPGEGLSLAESSRFDVILCDWKMPGFDGMDVVEELDSRSPQSAVVMITGYPSLDRATEAVRRGAMELIAKPFAPEEIVEAVRRAERQKAKVERKHMGRAEHILKSIDFPVAATDDRSPATIAETVAQKVGVGKVTSPWLSVLILAVLAGAYVGFGGLLATSVTFDMAGTLGVGFTKFMSGSVFSLGLILVIVAGAELFTGNNLMISSVMSRDITFGRMLERWALVYVANFVGSILVAGLFALSGLWKAGGGALGTAAVGVAYGKVSLSFIEAMVRGIGCNWLVCLAVWMALSARQTIGKIAAIFFPIMGFVAIGFEHSVANMYFIPAGLFLRGYAEITAPAGYAPEALTWGTFLVRNLLPVTIGNIIGGAAFVGMSYWSAFLRPQNRA